MIRKLQSGSGAHRPDCVILQFLCLHLNWQKPEDHCANVVRVCHVRKHGIEFKYLPNLDLKVSIVKVDTTVSDSPFQFL